jgi:hypothetical protein
VSRELEYREDPQWPGSGVYRGEEAIEARLEEYQEILGTLSAVSAAQGIRHLNSTANRVGSGRGGSGLELEAERFPGQGERAEHAVRWLDDSNLGRVLGE